MPTDILPLATRLFELRTEWWDLVFDDDYPGSLGPPAANAQLSRLTSAIGRHPPPSYLALLAAHDGWSWFEGDANLLSTTDRGEEWYRDARKLFAESLMPDPSPFDQYIPAIVGEDTRTAVFFDPAKIADDGEMEVVEVHDCREVYRFPDLPSFFEKEIAKLERMIDTEQNGDDP